MTKDKSTEEKILDAAHDVFIQKGMDGARTKEIAEKAGINKALLHYYYRTKHMLFLAVFKKVVSNVMPGIKGVFGTKMNFLEMLELFITEYITMIIKNPFLPGFIINEINRNPEKLSRVILESGLDPELVINEIKKAETEGLIKPIKPKHLIVNVLSLCVFPVAAGPMIQRVFFENDKVAYSEFLKERTNEVAGFIINSIKK